MSAHRTGGTAPSADQASAAYLLGLADDAMVYAQRLGEWLTHAPQIEEDMALANISLDLLGQARALYPRVGELDGSRRGEDDYAMLRDERDWRNVALVEQPRGDFADEMARLLWFSAARVQVLVAGSGDPVLDGVMGKGAKEVSYHLDHAAQWVVRLGDGTDESHQRMQAALERVAPYVEELFDNDPASLAVAFEVRGPLPSETRQYAVAAVERVLTTAGLTLPGPGPWRARGGRQGVHSRPMGSLLAELQHIARSHPGASW